MALFTHWIDNQKINVRTWANEFSFLNILLRKGIMDSFRESGEDAQYISAYNFTYFRGYADFLELQSPPVGNETEN